MNLIFTEKINGKPNGFIEKIWHSIQENNGLLWIEWANYLRSYKLKFGYNWHSWKLCAHTPKKHSIRIDKSDRWKVGSKIHFIINPYSSQRFQFAPILPVTAIQEIEIKNIFDDRHAVLIDGRELNKEEIKQLAANDGFDSVDEFWDYFKWEDLKGKVIHWTQDFKY